MEKEALREEGWFPIWETLKLWPLCGQGQLEARSGSPVCVTSSLLSCNLGTIQAGTLDRGQALQFPVCVWIPSGHQEKPGPGCSSEGRGLQAEVGILYWQL